MPPYKFPTREERLTLIESLKQLERESGENLDENELYQDFKKALVEMDKEMERLSMPDAENKDDPFARHLPPDLTEEDKNKLLGYMSEAGKAGEKYLAYLSSQDKNLSQGIPGIVNKLQGIMSKDFEAISAYDPKSKLSLPEIQEKARTRTIDFRGSKLITVGNMQNSRILMTLQNSRGERINGVFTRANYNTVKSDFNKMLNKAGEQSSPEGREEIGKILGNYKKWLIENGAAKRDRTLITEKESDDYIIGHLRKILYGKFKPLDEPIPRNELEEFLREDLKIDTSKISKDSMKLLTEGMTEFKKDVGAEISNWNLELKEGDRLDHRNSCMSAVAGMLGISNLVAKSESMNYIDEKGNVVEGTFMAFAKGIDLHEKPELFMHVNNNPFKKKGNLLKQISDLQILDYLCLNADRHAGNVMYQVDKAGNIVGIQAFDNDSSFGTRELADRDIAKLGVISKSMKEKLESIDPEMLKFTLRGRGLSEAEINKSAERLTVLNEKIKLKKVVVVDDKDFARLDIDRLCPPNKIGYTNMFKGIRDFVKESVKDARKAGIPFVPIEDEREIELPLINATERKGTVGGVEDSLRKLVVYKIENQNGLVTTMRGSSGKFDELIAATEKAQTEFINVAARYKIDKRAMLTEIEARPVLKGASEAFGEVLEKAEAYLQYKMKDKRVKSLDQLVGKNPYEQKHIDYAKQMIKFADDYFAQLEGPSNDREREETMANYEKRTIDQLKQAKQEMQKKQAPNKVEPKVL